MRIVLVMWPDSFEDWYGPLGLSREAYLDGYDGEWTIPLTAALVASGHDVHVVHGSRTGAAAGVQRPSGATTHFVRVPAAYRAFVHATWGAHRWPPLERLWPVAPVTAALSPSLVRLVRSLRPDAVLIQEYESLRYDVLAPVMRAAGLRVVGIDTGGSARPSRLPWKPATRRIAHRLLAVHDREAARLRAVGHRRVDVWPVPVRTEVFTPQDRSGARRALGLPAGGPIVFSAGRLHPVKNLTALARACAQLDVHLVLAGEGPERRALEARKDPGLRLLGWLPAEELAAWYGACDVVALASTQEGQPVAVLEALACGRGVVATAVGGIPEVVHGRCGGWLVRPRDDAALTEGLAAALADPSEADRRGALGREMVVSRHAPGMVARWFTERLSG